MIDNLELKLSGELPVTRKELFELVNSWGRSDFVHTNDDIFIDICEELQCYPLENLDVSQIKDLSFIFSESFYNGDLSKWDVSSCIDMESIFDHSLFNNNSISNWNISNVENLDYSFYKSKFNCNLSKWNISSCISMQSMFDSAEFNNNSLSNWNISNVKDMSYMFYAASFDGNISKWQFNKNVDCEHIFYNNCNFDEKYNQNGFIPLNTKNFLKWFEENKLNISNSNISDEEELYFEGYLNSFNDSQNNLVVFTSSVLSNIE